MMKQTLNAQRPTPNVQFRRGPELDVGCWKVDVGRSLASLR